MARNEFVAIRAMGEAQARELPPRRDLAGRAGNIDSNADLTLAR
jgi:hypothetical protein